MFTKLHHGLAVVLLGLPAAANATLIGDTVTFNTYFPDAGTLSSTQDLVVSNAIECDGCPSAGFVLEDQTLDIGDFFIEFRSSFITSFGGPDAIFEFLGLDAGSPITGFTLTTDFTDVTFADVLFSANSAAIDIGDSGAGTFWRLDFDVAVPEPSMLALLGLGLAGLGFSRRKKS